MTTRNNSQSAKQSSTRPSSTRKKKTPSQKVSLAQLEKVTQQALGYDELRPGQHEALNALLSGHDTLVVMPTGGGKSAIYQVAARLLPGPTVVVSPLLALQRDQIDSINRDEAHVGEAVAVNSTQSASERQQALEGVENGDIEFLFLAPEQFSNDDVLQKLRSASPSLIVIDEAHCISEWGHDFRPDYGRLGQVVETLGHPRVLALTATAAPPVRREIVEKLQLHNPKFVIHGFDRPNICLDVRPALDETAKRSVLIEEVVAAVKNGQQPGIIYAATRQNTEEIAQALQDAGVSALAYHAGMKTAEREETQSRFMNGDVAVIVATNAFGMGVDKADVRWVFHLNVSDSLDSYYQEIGRAGRDGEPARALLFYDVSDFNLHRFFAGGGRIEEEHILPVLQQVAFDEKITQDELLQKLDLSRPRLMRVLTRLEELQVLKLQSDGSVEYLQHEHSTTDVAESIAEKEEQRRTFERSRLQMMQDYAELRTCRRTFLLNYFGEEYPEQNCNNCDNCRNAAATATITEAVQDVPFGIGSQVAHDQWGEGQVLRYEADKVTVLFDSVGYKTLVVDLVLQNNLLHAVESHAA